MMVVRNANKRSRQLLTEVGNFRKVLRVSTSTKCNLPSSEISNASPFTTAFATCSSKVATIIHLLFIRQLYYNIITIIILSVFLLLDFTLCKNAR